MRALAPRAVRCERRCADYEDGPYADQATSTLITATLYELKKV